MYSPDLFCASMNPDAIAVRDLRRSFDEGGVHALQGVTFTLRPGEFVAVMGPSGSGKSTLLNILGGLDNDFEGEVVVDGQDLRQLRDLAPFRARVVGLV